MTKRLGSGGLIRDRRISDNIHLRYSRVHRATSITGICYNAIEVVRSNGIESGRSIGSRGGTWNDCSTRRGVIVVAVPLKRKRTNTCVGLHGNRKRTCGPTHTNGLLGSGLSSNNGIRNNGNLSRIGRNTCTTSTCKSYRSIIVNGSSSV